ncbi:hypothetical protein B0H67DRAFT_568431 [Lasiosphaeris hirsuta]|uniref:Uncharacterized protein n=1 Tax=Lasiosphaeris hirsuta TaxID=260670 RepID=A0AA40AZ38_9PEZI|nr:hypothetical protein B0H67DRAFT_568431 [Lasiosphaeris hirsuta]
MLMFEVFSSMGLGVQFRPVLCDPFDTKEDDTEEETPVSQAVIGETLKLMWYDNDRDEEMKEMYNWWAGKAAMTYAGRKGYIDAGRVLWLHGFDHKEPQLAWLAYGNEASISMECSSLAMIVKVSLGGVVGP